MTVAVLLAVDDRPDNLFVLEQLAGAYLPEIKIITAESAEAGLILATAEPIDGALIDLQMPGMNGIEMCRRLKADPRTASIHVILVTAHQASAKLKAQGLDAGADDFITKPIDNIELAAKLRVILRLRVAEDTLRLERDHLEEKVLERTKALRDAECRYRTLFQTAGDAIFISDLEGRILELNDEAYHLLGYTPDALLNLTVTNVVSPEYAVRRPEILKQLQATGHLVFESELVTRDGRIVPTECSSRLTDLLGQPAVLTIARDITEHKAAAAALRQSGEKLRAILDATPFPIAVVDLTDENIHFWSRSALTIFGHTAPTASEWYQLAYPDPNYRREAIARWKPALKIARKSHRTVNTGEYRITCSDGSIRICELYATFLPDILMVTFTDISDRQRAEQSLRESEARNRTILQMAMDGFLLADLQGCLLEVNQAYCRMSGYSEAELLAMSVSDLEASEGPADIATRMQRVIVQGQERFETRHRRKDGSIFEVEVSVQHKGGEEKQVFAFLRDITERKRDEAALKESLARVMEVQDGTIEALGTVSAVRDPFTSGHQRRVTQLAGAVARELGLSADRVAGLRVMGLLHDIGKISIPAEILSKPGKLTEAEFAIIKSHAQAGYEIIKEVRFPWPVAEVVLQHHERMDGSGYPQGLTGPDLILEGRILAVADVVEAMVSHRPYRPALGIESALEEITQKKGVLYDPEVVEACLKLFTEKGFQFDQ